jgi:hypothetical protein
MLSWLFSKPPKPKTTVEKFLETHEELNQRDDVIHFVELQDELIRKLPPRFAPSVRRCNDEHFLYEISYALTMYIPPLASYQKIRMRNLLAYFLKDPEISADKTSIVTYIITHFNLNS